MKRDCTNCGNFDKAAAPGNPGPCGPCVFSVGGAQPPSQWVAAQAPSAPTNAPFTDTQRLDWMLPLMSLQDDRENVGDKRTVALSAALVLGKSGRDAIDFAMEGSP